MRRINYIRTLDSEPLTVGRYDMEQPFADKQPHTNRPYRGSVRMKVLQCFDGETDVDLMHFVKQDRASADFIRNYPRILHDEPYEYDKWQIILFQVKAACVILEYGHADTKRLERIKLSLSGHPGASLQLEFQIPGAETHYHVVLECSRQDHNQPLHYKAVVTETIDYSQVQQCNLFTFDSDQPNLCFVSEYFNV